jgi:hypothetical protein
MGCLNTKNWNPKFLDPVDFHAYMSKLPVKEPIWMYKPSHGALTDNKLYCQSFGGRNGHHGLGGGSRSR